MRIRNRQWNRWLNIRGTLIRAFSSHRNSFILSRFLLISKILKTISCWSHCHRQYLLIRFICYSLKVGAAGGSSSIQLSLSCCCTHDHLFFFFFLVSSESKTSYRWDGFRVSFLFITVLSEVLDASTSEDQWTPAHWINQRTRERREFCLNLRKEKKNLYKIRNIPNQLRSSIPRLHIMKNKIVFSIAKLLY